MSDQFPQPNAPLTIAEMVNTAVTVVEVERKMDHLVKYAPVFKRNAQRKRQRYLESRETNPKIGDALVNEEGDVTHVLCPILGGNEKVWLAVRHSVNGHVPDGRRFMNIKARKIKVRRQYHDIKLDRADWVIV